MIDRLGSRREEQTDDAACDDENRPAREKPPSMCVDVIPALLRLEGCGNAHSVKGVHGNFAVNKREANRYEEQEP